jgi:hypothetical protein
VFLTCKPEKKSAPLIIEALDHSIEKIDRGVLAISELSDNLSAKDLIKLIPQDLKRYQDKLSPECENFDDAISLFKVKAYISESEYEEYKSKYYALVIKYKLAVNNIMKKINSEFVK